jgi:hypothetical protein
LYGNASIVLLQAQIALDPFEESLADFFASAVHRQNAHPLAEKNLHVAAFAWLEMATLLLQPTLQLSGLHAASWCNSSVVLSTKVLCRGNPMKESDMAPAAFVSGQSNSF